MVGTTALQLLKLAVLARFLAPEEFGLMAIVMVIVGFSQAFSDMGVSNAIIHRQEITTSQLSSLYWLNIMSGIALTLLVAGISPLVSDFFDRPQLAPMVIVVSSVFVINAVGQQFRVLCQKKLQFATVAALNLMAELVGMVAAIWLAWQGYGVWALVYSMIVAATFTSLGFLIVGVRRHHRPALIYRHDELSGFYGFGLYQMGERAINYVSANIDKVLIGKFAGMTAVGFYNMAWQLIIFPLSRINPVVNTVAFPTYALLQHDTDTRSRYYAASVRILSLVTVPLLAFVFFFASAVTALVFGPGWEQTAVLAQILTVVGVAKALGNPGGALLLSMGRADVGFWWNIVWAITVTLGILAALRLSPTAESAAFMLLGLSLATSFIWHYLIARIGKLDYWPIAGHFAKIVVMSMIVGLLAKTAVVWLEFESVIAQLIVASTSFGLLYLVYLALAERKFLLRVVRGA
jgi:O-antigen/teichoic acid export membrane protein